MDTAGVILISTAIVTSIVQLMKKTTPLEKIKDWIEWIAIVLGIAAFYVYSHAEGLEATIWSVFSNGLIVGLSAIGLYQTAGTTPIIKELVK